MEYNKHDTSSGIHDPDTSLRMGKSGRLEERPTVEDRKIEWQHMKGHVNQVQHHLHAAIEPLLSRIQMLEDTVAEQTKLLEKKVSDLSAPTLDSKLEDIAQHWVKHHFDKMSLDINPDDISGFEDAVYDVIDNHDFDYKVTDIIDSYDFGDIMSDAISDTLPMAYIHEVVQDFIHNKVKVVCDD
jgi:hypothetical protein